MRASLLGQDKRGSVIAGSSMVINAGDLRGRAWGSATTIPENRQTGEAGPRRRVAPEPSKPKPAAAQPSPRLTVTAAAQKDALRLPVEASTLTPRTRARQKTKGFKRRCDACCCKLCTPKRMARWCRRFARSETSSDIVMYLRAWLNIVACQALWLGAWTFLTVNVQQFWGWNNTKSLFIAFMAAGTLGLACMDYMYLDFGIAGSFLFDENDRLFGKYPAPSDVVERCCGGFISRLFLVMVNCTSLLCSIVNWVGITQLGAIVFGSWNGTTWFNVLMCLLSPVLMWASDTLFIDSGMDTVAETDPDSVPYWGRGACPAPPSRHGQLQHPRPVCAFLLQGCRRVLVLYP